MEPHELELRNWTTLLKQVDARLSGSARTLIHLMARFQTQGRVANNQEFKTVPTWISKHAMARSQSLLVHAVCGSTLQRLSRNRRRFRWLTDNDLEKLDEAVGALPTVFTQYADVLSEKDTLPYLATLDDDVFGAMNPLTAAEVFWVLIKAGEEHTHGPVGFLALFAMLWALSRRHKDASEQGAALEPWRPTAYATTKCLAPLDHLVRIMERRARFYRDIAKAFDQLALSAAGQNAYQRWTYAIGLDRLSRLLSDLAALTVAPDAFRSAAANIDQESTSLDQRIDLDKSWKKVGSIVRNLLGDIQKENEKALSGTRNVIALQEKIVELLKTPSGRVKLRIWCHQLPDFGDRNFDPAAKTATSHTNQGPPADAAKEYWKRHQEAAVRAAEISRTCLEKLEEGVRIAADGFAHSTSDVVRKLKAKHEELESITREPPVAGTEPWLRIAARTGEAVKIRREAPADADSKPWRTIALKYEEAAEIARYEADDGDDPWSMLAKICEEASKIAGDAANNASSEPWRRLAEKNEDVARLLREAVSNNVDWCHRVVRQEIAYASAENDTEFDPAELLSAIATAERWQPVSELEIEEAVRRSLFGARRDGSWATGQPIYMTKHVLGIWPSTSDIVLLLTNALAARLHIEHADQHLAKYVDWLERTGTTFRADLDGNPMDVSGWSTETREQYTIDLWTTAESLNALLEIRNLIEHRLWEMCERHFFVAKELKTLDMIDPVDAGAKHEHRLHHRLMRMTRETSGRNYKRAEYSFILHGPPGSSKTAIAEALGSEMWRDKDRRFVRVTPADFTRRGEEGLDAEARFIFDLLTHIRGATIFFDEIDDLLRRRKGEASFLKLVVPAMLNRLQDLRDAAPRQEICFLMATNFISNIEPALTRPGRIDAPVPVPYPDPWSRAVTLARHLQKGPSLDDELKQTLIDRTQMWPWSTLDKLCRAVAKDAGGSFVIQDLDELLDRFGSEFEAAEAYYSDREQADWLLSAPLVNEFVHLTFASTPSREGCESRVGVLAEQLRNRVCQALQKEWKRQHRQQPWRL